MPFKSEKQRRYLHANHPGIAKRWEQEYSGGGIARKNFLTGGFPDFFQMTPENMATARSTPWSTALNQDLNPWSKDYRGFTTGYRGADKSGLGKYVSGGLKSLVGAYTPGSNVGGATPLTRKIALSAMNYAPKALGIASKFLGPASFFFNSPAMGNAEVLPGEEDIDQEYFDYYRTMDHLKSYGKRAKLLFQDHLKIKYDHEKMK